MKSSLLLLATAVVFTGCATSSTTPVVEPSPRVEAPPAGSVTDSAELVEEPRIRLAEPVDYGAVELPSAVAYDGGLTIDVVDASVTMSRAGSSGWLTVDVTNGTGQGIERIAYRVTLWSMGNDSIDLDRAIRMRQTSVNAGDTHRLEIDLDSRLSSRTDEIFSLFDERNVVYEDGLRMTVTVFSRDAEGSTRGYRSRHMILQVVPEDALALYGHEQLLEAIRGGDADTVRELLEAGASPDTIGVGRTPALIEAILDGRGEIARLLIAAGADLNRKGPEGHNALSAALRAGDIDLLTIVTESGGTYTTADDFSPMQWAIEQGRYDVVALLLEAGGSLESPVYLEVDGRRSTCTMLEWATIQGDADLIETMLSLGASPSATVDDPALSRQYASPMLRASEVANLPLMTRFLEAGADPSAAGDSYGVTPLIAAAHYGSIEAVRLLTDAGADVNMELRDNTGGVYSLFGDEPRPGITFRDTRFFGATNFSYAFSALTVAARMGFTDIVEHLIASGADIERVFTWGSNYPSFTVLDIADHFNQPEVAAVLEGVGAHRLLGE